MFIVVDTKCVVRRIVNGTDKDGSEQLEKTLVLFLMTLNLFIRTIGQKENWIHTKTCLGNILKYLYY